MKTRTAYMPLEEGDIIAPGHYMSYPEGLKKCEEAIIGEVFSLSKHYQVFFPVEIPVSEPEPDPYAELKAAFAAGKVIQLFDGEWMDIDDAPPGWILPPDHYRVKPEPVKVPLGPEDVPPGSVFRPTSWILPNHYITIASVRTMSVCLNTSPMEYECDQSDHTACSWPHLMKHWEISRDGGKTWHPCWKEIPA